MKDKVVIKDNEEVVLHLEVEHEELQTLQGLIDDYNYLIYDRTGERPITVIIN